MKTTPLIKAALLLVALLAATVYAQEEDGGITVRPVEAFVCHYNEGKGPDDLQDAIDAWNEWMDENGHHNYFALVVTPQYFGELNMDFGWLGTSPTGAELGAGTDSFRNNGAEIGMKFAEASNCSSHINFASANVKAPPGNEPPENLVLSFSDCKVNEGNEWPAVFDALDVWAAYQTEQGSRNGSWVMFPAYGESDGDYDFKYVHSYANHEAMGQWWDIYGNGGGWQKAGEVFAGMLDCDSPRVYDARVVRREAPADE